MTGFTLAETLITLGIIGIVAAITISIIVNNTREVEIKASVKVASSMLSQAMTQAATEHGGTIKGICGATYDGDCFKELLKPYLNYTKDCDINYPGTIDCWAQSSYALSGDPTTEFQYMNAGLLLKNGMALVFRWHSADCTYPANAKCGWIAVDINGLKPPNTTGKDIFIFSAQDGTIKPFGIPGDASVQSTCDASETGRWSGWGCAAEYLY